MFLNYEPLIRAYTTEMQTEIDNQLLCKVSQTVGFSVNKDELIKALQYDRHQYEKGVSDTKLNYLAVDTLIDKCSQLFKELQSSYTISDEDSVKINELISEINEYIK